MSEDEYRRVFQKKLNYFMNYYNKTQQDLINDLGFNSPTVSSWVNGHRLPRMDKIQKLADYFGIEKSDLIEEKPEDNYYLDAEARQIAEFLYKNEGHRALFSAMQNVKAEDLNLVKELIERFSSKD